MKQILQYLFVPFTLLTSLLLTIFLLSKLDQPYFILIPIAVNVVLIGWFLFGEWLIPYRQEWRQSKGDVGSDAIRTFFVLPAASKFAEWSIPFLLYIPLKWLSGSPSFYFSVLAEEYGLLLVFLIALFACEFLYYWCHRLFHQIPVLWRFHAVHHGAGRVYWLNAGRFHAVEAFVSSFIYFLPLAILNVPIEVSVLVISVSAVTGFLEHVNVDFKAGILNYIFNTADLHRWHHSRVIDESNKNYGKVLVIWDQLFGTFFLPRKRVVEEVGTIENDTPADFIGQARYPFKKKKS